jgi:cobalt-zinc-cadmium efflux system outer membrane protein
MAEAQFRRAKLLVGSEVLRLVSEVQSAYYTALWADQVARMRREIAKSAEASFELSKRMHEAGNASDLAVANHQAAYESARVGWSRAEAEAYAGRERLNVLMGLWGEKAGWKFEGNLPDLPQEEIPLDRLEPVAVAQRLDLAAARQESETVAHALSIARRQGGVTSAEVGVSSERETHGGWVAGPFLKLELPIFHQGQAGIARLEAQLRQAERRHEARAVEVRAEVRELRHRLVSQRNLAKHYREVLIPVRERIVALTLERYNFMLTGVFELITARREEFEAYQAYLEAVRDYWIARSRLRLAVGGRLPGERGNVQTAAQRRAEGGKR